MMRALIKMLAPEKALHNEAMVRADASRAEEGERNLAMCQQAMDMAAQGFRVRLEITNGTWVSFTCEPTEYVGRMPIVAEKAVRND